MLLVSLLIPEDFVQMWSPSTNYSCVEVSAFFMCLRKPSFCIVTPQLSDSQKVILSISITFLFLV